MDGKNYECQVVPCDGVKTSSWYAWNNLMPPKPDDFHVIGQVEVPNPGVEALLSERVPQGINPKILLLDLVLLQKPGVWPRIITTKEARFDKTNVTYSNVEVFCGNHTLANTEVQDVH